MMKLIIGNKQTSSWSLRPWVLMKHFDIPFEEKLISLYGPHSKIEILKYSPNGQVPCLIDGATTVWDSLAIAEYLNDKFPTKKMWPSDPHKKAMARSVSCEMHSSFQNMRHHMSHDVQKKLTNFDWSVCASDVNRVKKIWTDCLNSFGGPYLFGDFSIADAMYAPVVNRFISYGIPVFESEIKKYMELMRALPAHRAWLDVGSIEKLEI